MAAGYAGGTAGDGASGGDPYDDERGGRSAAGGSVYWPRTIESICPVSMVWL